MLDEPVIFRSILKRFKISSYYLKNYFPEKRLDENAQKLHEVVLKIGGASSCQHMQVKNL